MILWFWYFVIYSFLGFLTEVAFARLTRNPKRDRKCRYFLPLCPVYGLGAIAILLLPEPVRQNPLLLFPCSALGPAFSMKRLPGCLSGTTPICR